MFAAASTAPSGVRAKPRARPPLVSCGPAVTETGTFAPATLTQLRSPGFAESRLPDGTPPAAGAAAGLARTAAVPGPGSHGCPTATTSRATTIANPRTTAAVATTTRVRGRATSAMSSVIRVAMASQHRADDSGRDRPDGQP